MAKDKLKAELKASVANSPFKDKAIVAVFDDFEKSENAVGGYLTLLSGLYLKSAAAGFTEDHVDAIHEKIVGIKIEAWLAKNPHCAKLTVKAQEVKGRPQKDRRADKSIVRKVVRASEMRFDGFVPMLLANTKSPGMFADVCGEARKVWGAKDTKGTLPTAKWTADKCRELSTKKRDGGGASRKWKASQRIKVMQDHAKALSLKSFASIAQPQITNIITSLDAMMKRAIKTEKKDD